MSSGQTPYGKAAKNALLFLSYVSDKKSAANEP